MRQARRQGLLVGNRISPVQQKALRILEYLDSIEREAIRVREQDVALRLAMGAAGGDFVRLFPEVFNDSPPNGNIVRNEPHIPVPQGVTSPNEERYGDDVDLDYSQVNWLTPGESPELYEELMRQVNELSTGSVNGSQITQGDSAFGEWR